MSDAWPTVRAYAVHLFTASGVLCALAALWYVMRTPPAPAWAFAMLGLAVLIDAADGPLARRWAVTIHAARIDGGLIDNIVDYLTFTFLPLVLVWRMGWLAGPDVVWVGLAMTASLFGFANHSAKQAADGFFLGFPSYWNILAYYAGLLHAAYGATGRAVMLGVVLLATALTVAPVRFIYPNQAPSPWKPWIIGGALGWLALLVGFLPTYPAVPTWAQPWGLPVSMLYPAFYVGLSGYLDVRLRRAA
ncbi:CDP-alcohol phosphatidyltransferase family protein [Salisaeta longa]|uniref:CDP-alcohol phosphatidyltransferase family protein n=1 Tax=Salisaeta longa TaxID=503170 RepID=UPI0003B6BD98|nr:CDP-alcohol phosphatidyltransferase family protein [Salisaeta longa]